MRPPERQRTRPRVVEFQAEDGAEARTCQLRVELRRASHYDTLRYRKGRKGYRKSLSPTMLVGFPPASRRTFNIIYIMRSERGHRGHRVIWSPYEPVARSNNSACEQVSAKSALTPAIAFYGVAVVAIWDLSRTARYKMRASGRAPQSHVERQYSCGEESNPGTSYQDASSS